MSRITAALEALTRAADPTTTLVALTITVRIDYPAGLAIPLDRGDQKQLRRLERATRTALKQPPATRYSVLPGASWHIVLAPHAAEQRVYLARAGCQRHYRHADDIAAPPEPPATLIASWTANTTDTSTGSATATEHHFTGVADPEQLGLLMHYSTADRYVYLSPLTPQSGIAALYTTSPR